MYHRGFGCTNRCGSAASIVSSDKTKLERAPSLDSLGNSNTSDSSSGEGEGRNMVNNTIPSDNKRDSVPLDNYMEVYQEINNPESTDNVSDVDSIEDAQEGRGIQTTKVQVHASRMDIEYDDEEAVVQSEIPKDPVVKAYLENASHICQNNCVKSMAQFNVRTQPDDNGIWPVDLKEDAIVPSSGGNSNSAISIATSAKNQNRRASLSSGSVGRMETIVEEPIEPKVSVKEILARFETLRESAEVNVLAKCEFL